MSVTLQNISYNLIDGIFDVLSGKIYNKIDTITLTGSSGTATIVHNGVSKVASFSTSLTITAQNFVTANAAAYLAVGSVITSSGAILSFTPVSDTYSGSIVTTIANATANLSGTVTLGTYPVYKSIPKPPASIYVWIGGVIQTEDGTKDDFCYRGAVQVQVAHDGLMRADMKLVQGIDGVMKGLLKTSKGSVFSISPNTLILFSHESSTEMSEQNAEGIYKVRIANLFNFLIE